MARDMASLSEVSEAGEERVSSLARFGANAFPYFLLAPALIILSVIFIYPLAHGLWLSLHDYNLNTPWKGMQFVGLANYFELFQERSFYQSLGRTLYWVVGSVGGELAVGMIAALLLNQTFVGRSVARAIILIPWAVPTVLAAIVFSTMFNTLGIINEVLLGARIISQPIPWLSSTDWAMPTLIIAHIWKSFPFVTIVLLAGLQSIPRELYEAAEIDGAGEWAKFWNVTIPGLRGVMVIAVLLTTIFSLKGVDFQYIMTYGGPADSTKVIAFHAYRTAFAEFDFGMASAIAFVIMIITSIICFFYLQLRGTE
ncbi:carbohydrate ABC transporter permease [Devosia nitrariae]|uniref:Sugar ABC transporter permease n=1 Tax=Devosia nitrariae TaxID=2071872 RepID=A0ABQ5W7M4_9HYPH|nr:sugar ABC transporter permease [Devosia nitrariae]GLQ55600.1 sugar ABC transporter permease [Devosia nitrariae]